MFLTYPPEQVLLGGGVEDLGYLQVGIHTETVFGHSGGGGPSQSAILFVSWRSRFHVRILQQLQTKYEKQISITC